MPLPSSTMLEDQEMLHYLFGLLKDAGNPDPERTLQEIQRTYPRLGWLKHNLDLDNIKATLITPVDPLRAVHEAQDLWDLSRTAWFKRKKRVNHVSFGVEMGRRFSYLQLRHPQTFSQIYHNIQAFDMEMFRQVMKWYLASQWKKQQEILSKEQVSQSSRALPVGSRTMDHPLDELPKVFMDIIHIKEIRAHLAKKKNMSESDLEEHARDMLAHLEHLGGSLLALLEEGHRLEDITPEMIPAEEEEKEQEERFRSEAHDYLRHRPSLIENPLAMKEEARRRRVREKRNGGGRGKRK